MSNVFDPYEFANWLTYAFQESHYKSWQEVADLVDTSRSTLSRYAGAKLQTLTEKPSQPNSALVIKLAKLFNRDVDKALMKAGHAPVNQNAVSDPEGFYSGINKLPTDRQAFARRQVKAIIDALAEEEDPDTDYIDD